MTPTGVACRVIHMNEDRIYLVGNLKGLFGSVSEINQLPIQEHGLHARFVGRFGRHNIAESADQLALANARWAAQDKHIRLNFFWWAFEDGLNNLSKPRLLIKAAKKDLSIDVNLAFNQVSVCQEKFLCSL